MRYDKAQTLTAAHQTQARTNIGTISADDLPSPGSQLEGAVRYDVIQSDDAFSTFVNEEEVNRARDNLRLNNVFINFTLSVESLMQLITVEQAAAVRAALGFDNTRTVHVRKTLLEQPHHFTYVRKNTLSHTDRRLTHVERHDHFTNVRKGPVRHVHNTLRTQTNFVTTKRS